MSSPAQEPKRVLGKQQDLEIDKLFRALVKNEGSDLHLKVGCAPFIPKASAESGLDSSHDLAYAPTHGPGGGKAVAARYAAAKALVVGLLGRHDREVAEVRPVVDEVAVGEHGVGL